MNTATTITATIFARQLGRGFAELFPNRKSVKYRSGIKGQGYRYTEGYSLQAAGNSVCLSFRERTWAFGDRTSGLDTLRNAVLATLEEHGYKVARVEEVTFEKKSNGSWFTFPAGSYRISLPGDN